MRLAFMGTPEFSVKVLAELIAAVDETRSLPFLIQARRLAAASETAYPTIKMNASWTRFVKGLAVTEYFWGTAITG